MKYDSELTQNLVTLVKDGITSKKSKVPVMLHLKKTHAYKDAYEATTQIDLPTLSKNSNRGNTKVKLCKEHLKKRRKADISLAALHAVILVIGVCLTTACALVGSFYSTRDIAEYGNYSGHMEFEQEGMFSLLEIFPLNLHISAVVKDFYYFCNNGGIDNSYQLYLVCSYAENDYILEKERLTSIALTFEDEIHQPTISDKGFKYPAIVTIFNDQKSFEYALLDDDTNTIAYIFAQSMGINTSIVPSKYRPQGFLPPENELTKLGSYNIYRFKIDDDTFIIPKKDDIIVQ